MLVTSSHLIGTPVLSMQATGPIGQVADTIVDPDSLKIIAFTLSGPLMSGAARFLDVSSIREYSNLGIVIDAIDELVAADEVIKISRVLELNFALPGLKVESRRGTKLGKVIDFTVSSDDFLVQQIIVKRPLVKSFIDPELTIPRSEIIEITDYKIIVKDEEKTIRARAEREDFIPNFVNPFRNSEQGFAPIETQTPDDKDKQ